MLGWILLTVWATGVTVQLLNIVSGAALGKLKRVPFISYVSAFAWPVALPFTAIALHRGNVPEEAIQGVRMVVGVEEPDTFCPFCPTCARKVRDAVASEPRFPEPCATCDLARRVYAEEMELHQRHLVESLCEKCLGRFE